MSKKIIAASILSADFSRLGEEVNAAIGAGCDYIHFDVMDHHFVPNLSFGAVVCQSLRRAGIKAPIDVHLMVDTPQDYIGAFAKAGADLITFHPETVDNVGAVIDEIHAAGMQAGLAFNPDKHVDIPLAIAQRLDLILLMSVYPGFGGQEFIPDILPKARHVRQWLDDHELSAILAIDGGIKVDNIAQTAHAGIDFFVVGSGLYAAKDYGARVNELRAMLR